MLYIQPRAYCKGVSLNFSRVGTAVQSVGSVCRSADQAARNHVEATPARGLAVGLHGNYLLLLFLTVGVIPFLVLKYRNRTFSKILMIG